MALRLRNGVIGATALVAVGSIWGGSLAGPAVAEQPAARSVATEAAPVAAAVAASAPAKPKVIDLPRISAPSGRWFRTEDGRVALLRGTAAAARASGQTFQQLGFGQDDARFLREQGFNVVRLGITWANLQPKARSFSKPYLKSVKQTIRMLAKQGIYTIVDFHQDQFSELYGDGAPGWATVKRGTSTPQCGFPLNLKAGVLDCRTDINNAYAAFWRNEKVRGKGLQQWYGEMLKRVVTEFKPLGSAVIGYELMNEPYPGLGWQKCYEDPAAALPVRGCKEFERGPLARFYRKMIPIVQAADSQTVVFYEPVVLFDLGAPTYLPKFKFDNIAFAFHPYDYYYQHSYTGQDQEALRYGQKMRVPIIATEFGATPSKSLLEESMAGFNQTLISATEWTYYNDAPFEISPGQGNVAPPPPSAQSMVFDPRLPPIGANVQKAVVQSIAQPFPHYTCGTPRQLDYQPATGQFTYVFTPKRKAGAKCKTVIKVSQSYQLDGISVQAKGASVKYLPGRNAIVVTAKPKKSRVTVTAAPLG